MALTEPPKSPHSIEDRKALTSDALKLSRHELEKEFTRRISAIKQAIDDEWEATLPLRDAYNMAVAKLIRSVSDGLVDELQHSFRCLNRMLEDDDDAGVEAVVRLGSERTFFHGSKEGSKALLHQMGALLEEWVVYSASRPLQRGYIKEFEDEECWADDLRAPLEVTIVQGDHAECEINRTFCITCSFELEQARRALAAPSKKITQLEEQLQLAMADHERLPEMIRELDMQATAIRLRDAGGELFLHSIMDGVRRIMNGENISGLTLALQDTEGETSDG